jgi:hypothetical protein
LSNNLGNENINTGVSREMIFQKYVVAFGIWHFDSHFALKHLFQVTEKEQRTKKQQLFDKHLV